MIRKIVLSSFIALSLCVSSASAADVKKRFSIKEAMDFSYVQEVLSGDVAMYWGSQPHGKVESKFGIYKTSKRTNGFMQESEDACARALASALAVLQERAEKEGANAVIEIKSNAADYEESSTIVYSCLVGRVMVNVALKGTVVTLER